MKRICLILALLLLLTGCGKEPAPPAHEDITPKVYTVEELTGLSAAEIIAIYGEDYTVPMGEYRLNEEEIYSNDTMIFKGTGETAYLYAKGARHTVNLDWSDNLPFLCIWKEDSSAAKFICLEPWSDIPADGVIPENFEERKMSRLRKGECESYTYTVKLN